LEIDRIVAALEEHSGAIVAVPVVDTLKRGNGDPTPLITDTVRREQLWRALTPQGFRYADIMSAHELAAASGRDSFTDDASIAEAAGLDVALIEGSEHNFKITTPADFERAEKELHSMPVEFRTGSGFDVHAFDEGDHVWLCGVKIAHEKSLSGHSDADVAMHALTDAIYGALAEGDIGHHFPPSNPQWKGASSNIFLAHARDRVAARGGSLVNVDVTILCEAPTIGPHRDAMRSRLAEILHIDVSRVAVKATTTEQLGFTGRREGIAAMASATVRLD
jgi:2-C-methyl-D-erythritol 4-phosphate cytidylyltransferase/2-C-methyl-D-erythritol 2,4-cyclodiphosphate synthase